MLIIGLYTAGGFLAILVIFLCVMGIEKCRRARKRITEVVDLQPEQKKSVDEIVNDFYASTSSKRARQAHSKPM